MERMIRDVEYHGESYVYANDSAEYQSFVNWLYAKGAKFAYHFETGEAFWFKDKILEVYGV